jgi:hypothetical protein
MEMARRVIDDPAVLAEIDRALATAGYAKR